MQVQSLAWRALAAQPLHLLAPGALLAALVLAFVTAFLLPGLLHWWRLSRLHRALRALPPHTPPNEFRRLFAKDARFAHLWKEFQDSLHVQREERDGQLVTVAVRSTLPAETFFNSQYVVDGRLRTEFFKHLPGIFTGIGIIGTFTGLIDGLRRFQVSDNAATVRTSLESLMHSVGQAFLISASAIAAAMIVTFFEKLLLSALYGRTEDIAHAIDAHFDTGAGEDYLSRLVMASEAAAGQSRSLKDDLVRDLSEVMRAQTERQISGLATAISAGIEQALAVPLQKIAASVQTATGDQSLQTTQMLQDVLGRFADKLDAAIGGQVAGLETLSRQSGESTQDALRALHQLVDGIATNGRNAGEQMGTQLQASLDAIGRQMGGLLGAIDDNQRRAAEGQREREQTLVAQTGAASERLSDLLAEAVAQMSAASAQMARSVDALTHTTATALETMTAGADKLSVASNGFATAGERVGTVMTDAARVAAQLALASGSLSESATDLRSGLDDYRDHRDAVGNLVTELRATVALARKESGLTADVLQRIQTSTERLGAAQAQADDYLEGVSRVLGEAHVAFALSVKKTLALANTEFHTKLSTAVGLLSSTVVELEATLGQAALQRH
jgi:hypothetical protein